jgi:hypothetical protein
MYKPACILFYVGIHILSIETHGHTDGWFGMRTVTRLLYIQVCTEDDS